MYMAQSLSRKQIRELAYSFRKLLGLETTLYFPILQLLEHIHFLDPDAHFEVVCPEELDNPDAHGETDIVNKCIKIRYDVYERACAGCGRDRMTIAHELGHFILILIFGVKLYRTFDATEIKAYNDPEWQAKCFGGELLIPSHLVRDMTTDEVVEKCGVTLEAAKLQLGKIQGERGKAYANKKKTF